MARRLIYSLSTGRCGTLYLTNLLRANLPREMATVHHERFGYLNFGIHTPDMSHMTTFNSVGNISYVRDFWRRKLSFDSGETAPIYIELSHVLAKAGLLENLDLVDNEIEIDVIILTRKIEDVVWSYINHFDFVNFGFTWPFTLDPRYPNTILRLRPLENLSPARVAHWYVCEMSTRAAYYEVLLQDRPKLRFHRISLEEIAQPAGAESFLHRLLPDSVAPSLTLPKRTNETPRPHFPSEFRAEVDRLCAQFFIDPTKLARAFIDSNRRLADPPYRQRPAAAAAIARYPSYRA